ncbi:hypothetical protein PHBOTO_000600 [Pseudozyma hubeiensis]|nr:hypothetical protein PHBOTO_000600 [Pseudozyma hubeiensis]
MSTSSASPPSASSSTPINGRKRTRNAQAQADLRVRRKNYIKTLEETVSRLEACVVQLREKNASSGGGVCRECEGLRAENDRLREMLGAAGLVEARGGEASVLSSSKGTGARAKPIGGGEEQVGWSNTSSITTKKRKLSKMYAFAQQVDSQLGGSSHVPTGVELSQQLPESIKQAWEMGATTSNSDTPSSSRDSDQRSPQTPRSNPPSTINLGNKVELIDTTPFQLSAAATAQDWQVYPPASSTGVTPNAMLVPSTFGEHPSNPLQADLTTWLMSHAWSHGVE